jgi:D-alanine-D-alanine ligase
MANSNTNLQETAQSKALSADQIGSEVSAQPSSAQSPSSQPSSTQPQPDIQHQSIPKPGKYTIVLLCGGKSNEREISLASADNVQKALSRAGHKVVTIDTADPMFFRDINHAKADVVFIALHGTGGEDGCIQGVLELIGIPYTGSGVLASALAMDKFRSKIVYEDAGLKTPSFIVLKASQKDSPDNNPDAIIAKLGLPCVVKPAADGSSVGISIVHTKAELPQAINTAFESGDTVLLEAFVSGVEITIPVIGGSDPKVLPAIEIIPTGEFYDYQSKYTQGGSQHIIPARITQEVLDQSNAASLLAHKALDCWGVSRTDLIVDANNVPWVIETNTIPGMTETSLLPDAASYIGIDQAELYEVLIEYAFERAQKQG